MSHILGYSHVPKCGRSQQTTLKLFLAIFIALCSHVSAYETCIRNYLQPINEVNSSSVSLIDCIYIINLERRPDRWIKAQNQFKKHNINPTRVNAIDGWLLTEDQKTELCGHYPLRLSGGQIGCILSHLSILQDAYNRELDAIWVCEDDIVIRGDPHEVSYYINQLNQLAPDWDVFYTNKDFVESDGKIVRALWHDFRPDVPHEDLWYYLTDYVLTEEITKIGQRYGTASMIVSRRGIQKIIDYFTTLYLWTAYDIDIHYIPGLNQYALNRDLASSDIHSTSDISSNYSLQVSNLESTKE